MTNWTKDNLTVAIGALNQSFSVTEACEKMAGLFKHTTLLPTPDAVRRAFNRHGLKNPSSYLNRSWCNTPEDMGVSEKVINNNPSATLKFSIKNKPSPGLFKIDKDSFIDEKTLKTIFDVKIPVDDFMWRFSEPPVAIRTVKPVTKIMVLPDCHFPYVDKKAWKVFLNALKAVQPDILVSVGDLIDMLSVSRHPKKPKDETKLLPEIVAGRQAIKDIRSVFKGRFVFIAGNHENRLDRYIASEAPALDELIDLKDLLKLDENNVEYYPYGEFLRIGEMSFTHDVGRCGVNAARQSLADFGDNLAFGHSHRASVVYGGTVEGKTHVCINVGHLADYDSIDYRNKHTAKREWQHGFGFIYQSSKGVSWANFVPIINGECIVDGKFIDAN